MYMEEGKRLMKVDNYERDLVYKWMFLEKYRKEKYIEVSRDLKIYNEREGEEKKERIEEKMEGGEKEI